MPNYYQIQSELCASKGDFCFGFCTAALINIMAQKDSTTFEKFELSARGKRNSCEVCSKELKLFVREHQRKRCGRAVCEERGSYKLSSMGSTSRVSHTECASYVNPNRSSSRTISNTTS